MKTSNKLIILSAVVCISICSIAVLKFMKSVNTVKDSSNVSEEHVPDKDKISETDMNISEPVEEKTEKYTYLLKISNDKICAYMVKPTGEEILWNSMDIPAALSTQDRKSLNNGITTDDFEKLCLYFENYAS